MAAGLLAKLGTLLAKKPGHASVTHRATSELAIAKEPANLALATSLPAPVSGQSPDVAPQSPWQADGADQVFLSFLRSTLYDKPEAPSSDATGQPAKMSTRLRIAVHVINCTMILVAMPVGIAMLAHSILRGEDMRFTGRLTTLTGLALAVWASPLAQALRLHLPL